ncbi:hypothetical protein OHS58_27105 [Amycolatopsis sp. NBC_00348]|uniref:CorA family divalent cation transporter n=1 Tax=Amycolatopsis sp. NBC_00348 TaxID=2975956 RepID=UPI002E274C14
MSDFLADEDTAVWVDLCEPTEADLAALTAEFGLHRLAVEDAVHEHQPFFDEATAPYFQDVYDHVLRASEWTKSLRELVSTIRETQLNLQSNRLNLIMKKVTGWAAVIAVPAAVTGFFGQNVPYPGSGSSLGFWMSTLAIVLLSALLFGIFRRRDRL